MSPEEGTAMDHQQARDEIVALAASLFQRGFSVGSAGNITVRVDGGFLATPTNSSLGRLDAARLSLLDEDWNHLDGDKPTKEVFLHQAVYDARPSATAIVHLHSTYVTALSCLPPGEGPLIPPYTPYFVMRAGEDVPVVPYFRPGTADMVPQIRDAARRSPAFILAHHGSIVAASSLVSAVNTAEEMEESARIAYLLHGRGASTLTAEQMAALRG